MGTKHANQGYFPYYFAIFCVVSLCGLVALYLFLPTRTLVLYVVHENGTAHYLHFMSKAQRSSCLDIVDYVVGAPVGTSPPVLAGVRPRTVPVVGEGAGVLDDEENSFCGWGALLDGVSSDQYDTIVFVSSAVQGPHGPPPSFDWIAGLTAGIDGHRVVAATTVPTCAAEGSTPAINTQAWALSGDVVDAMQEAGLFACERVPRRAALVTSMLERNDLAISTVVPATNKDGLCVSRMSLYDSPFSSMETMFSAPRPRERRRPMLQRSHGAYGPTNCGVPNPVPNSDDLHLVACANSTNGTTCTPECLSGFFLSGSGVFVCEHGEWTGRPTCNDLDECEVEVCASPPNVCVNTVGSYICKCGEEFVFSAASGTCIPAGNGDCTVPPPAVEHSGNQHVEECHAVVVGSVCPVTCNTGYEQTADFTCSAGTFNTDVSCIDIDGCLDHQCALEDAGATCEDKAAPARGAVCQCSLGYHEVDGVCIAGTACASSPPAIAGSDGSETSCAAGPTGTTCPLTCADAQFTSVGTLICRDGTWVGATCQRRALCRSHICGEDALADLSKQNAICRSIACLDTECCSLPGAAVETTTGEAVAAAFTGPSTTATYIGYGFVLVFLVCGVVFSVLLKNSTLSTNPTENNEFSDDDDVEMKTPEVPPRADLSEV